MNTARCVHCGKEVFEFAVECPYCKKPIANPHAPTNVSADPKTWKKTSDRKRFPFAIVAVCLAAIAIAVAVLYVFKLNGFK